eukprot:CAMPEP_0177638076 /NCGR_PEP_ID=MMETSP0447-20121125/5300_1 /TAXON_ID=0 /ORGANISM="Stygamoeba regulata, Strain BSH-02190019" /LENGTH=311 /DNA_ID=CAMNT_0019140023 /DNA_START=1600 /DNA_END=2535 /DNA_ORIENTATION=+
MAAPGNFIELCKLCYKDQAVWFINGFWTQVGPQGANQIWDWWLHFVELDKQSVPPRGEAGSELDKFWSAKFLEDKDSAMTLAQRKQALADIDLNHDGKMSLLEYLAWKYKKSVKDVENAPQGANQAKIEAAQRKMDEVQAALADVEASIQAVKDANAAVLSAEAELQAAQAELKAQEDAYHGKMKELEEKSKSGPIVQKNKAANELAQLKSEDPLPLRKAKITNEAALRKVAKETKAAHEAIDEGERKKELLGQKMEEAQAELEEAKRGGGVPYGAVYWMERQLFEADKSLSRAKQKYDHSKPFTFNPDAA